MNATNSRWVYQVFDPRSATWVSVKAFSNPRQPLWRLNYSNFAITDGQDGTASRVCDALTGDVVEMTQYIRERDAARERLERMASDYEYQVISEGIGSSRDRYFLIVERPCAHWQPVETTRHGIPRGYKTLRSALNALWKRHEAKSGQRGERYALVDLQCDRVIRESIIDIAKFMNVRRPLLRRKATVAMLEQAIA